VKVWILIFLTYEMEIHYRLWRSTWAQKRKCRWRQSNIFLWCPLLLFRRCFYLNRYLCFSSPHSLIWSYITLSFPDVKAGVNLFLIIFNWGFSMSNRLFVNGSVMKSELIPRSGKDEKFFYQHVIDYFWITNHQIRRPHLEHSCIFLTGEPVIDFVVKFQMMFLSQICIKKVSKQWNRFNVRHVVLKNAGTIGDRNYYCTWRNDIYPPIGGKHGYKKSIWQIKKVLRLTMFNSNY